MACEDCEGFIAAADCMTDTAYGLTDHVAELEKENAELRARFEWQPMDAAPEKTWMWCKFRVPTTGAVYVSVFTKSVHGEFINWMTGAHIEPELMIAHIVLPTPEQ